MHPQRLAEHKRSVLPGASDRSRQSPHFSVVMAGLGLAWPGHPRLGRLRKDVDARDKRMTVKEIYARRYHAGTQERLS
jgi:hypothetical protein